jgi:uncharacterized cupredoxin-like copper-binding protein
MRITAPSMIAVAATVALLGAAGCGSDDNSSNSSGSSTDKAASSGGAGYGGGTKASGGGETLKLSADPGGQLKFDKSSLTAKAGKVTLVMTNPSGATAPHAIAVEGNGVDKDGPTVQPGAGTSKITVDLKAGKYEFYCPVDGHRAAGMEGTLTVG